MDLGERQEMINEGSRLDLQASKIWLGRTWLQIIFFFGLAVTVILRQMRVL